MASPPPQITIRLPTPQETNNTATINHLDTLINTVYFTTEGEYWKPGHHRSTPADIKTWIAAGELYLAIDSSNHEILGVVCLHPHHAQREVSTYTFGPLAVSQTQSRSGVGRRLVLHAESVARSRGAEMMEITLLEPKPPAVHPYKEMVRRWYVKLGYVGVRREAKEEVVPASHCPTLAEGIDFLVMEKRLWSALDR
ncbi:hypothetical protein BDY17DRAFT_326959 [Neohortaea acidophila]|uniref:N-acetyltransferase domain-containing protein n=1 Tax=Neohortaea acidophila TaxID=245834 RepID=A0A6A6PJW0_9PEZI|nr:uncharacterized protein BDY17DRAFT_326959 [Neohortaea acidophila]KAF2479964.1 hypothetical protein BDY17DRAFT_326959 [Neohortaea acidophila]